MKKKINIENINYFDAQFDPKFDMESKESVRTTLKLTAEAIDGLKWLQKTYKITVKEIFDHIVEGIGSYLFQLNDMDPGDILPEGMIDYGDIIQKTREQPKQLFDCTRKTYVLSKGALIYFNSLSKEDSVSRDDLISNIIVKMKDQAKAKREINKKKYIEALEILSEFEAHAKDIYSRLGKMLGDNFDLYSDVENLILNTIDTGTFPLIKEKLNKLIKEK